MISKKNLSLVWMEIEYGLSITERGNKDYFRSIDETITGKVRFGDDYRIDIKW